MKNRVLSIGCNSYASESFSDLSGAENDAQNIYECLVDSGFSIYEKSKSVLLNSPTLDEVRKALESVLIDTCPPDVFTFFFAGHGGVQSGTYYLCLKDSSPDRMSFSALSLSEVFRMIASSGVKHANLIIDACNTGGLVNDLTSFIKPELIGPKGSFGVSILAAAASDEYAAEYGGQGLLTGTLVQYLDGTKQITTSTEYLDLVTVGRVISTSFLDKSEQQTPSSWGFNLYGPSVFARNPFYDPDDALGVHEFTYIPPSSQLGKLIQDAKKDLLDVLDNFNDSENSAETLALFQRILGGSESEHEVLAFVKGVGYPFLERLETTARFKALEFANVLITALVPHSGSEQVKAEIGNLISTFTRIGGTALEDLHLGMVEDKDFLLCKGSGGFGILANYYYLPIRISKVLGVLAQLVFADPAYLEKATELVRLINERYPKHFVCMSDVQSPYLYVFFKVFRTNGSAELAKSILIQYLGDFLSNHGQVSKLDLTPEKAATFLLQRYTREKIDVELTANPGELGTALLMAASDFNVGDDLDSELYLLDRKNFLLFIPTSTKDFSKALIEDGMNLVLRCGFDFWHTSEFSKICLEQINMYLKDRPNPMEDLDLFCYVASSYVQPNRLPVMFG